MLNLRSLFITALLITTPAAVLCDTPEAAPMPAEPISILSPEMREKIAILKQQEKEPTEPTPASIFDFSPEQLEKLAAGIKKHVNREKRREKAQDIVTAFNNREYKSAYHPAAESRALTFDHCRLVNLYQHTPQGEENIAATAEEIEDCAYQAKHRHERLMRAAQGVRRRAQEALEAAAKAKEEAEKAKEEAAKKLAAENTSTPATTTEPTIAPTAPAN